MSEGQSWLSPWFMYISESTGHQGDCSRYLLQPRRTRTPPGGDFLMKDNVGLWRTNLFVRFVIYLSVLMACVTGISAEYLITLDHISYRLTENDNTGS